MKNVQIEFVVRSNVLIPDEFASNEMQAWEYIREHFGALKNQIDASLDLQYDTIECVEFLEEENDEENEE